MNRNIYKWILGICLTVLMSYSYAQTAVNGTIIDAETGEPLIGTQILVKGTVLGTISDVNGNFALSVQSPPPITLVITYVGYERQEIEVTSSGQSLDIQLAEATLLGQEVVVSASRVEENILQSPVSIEKMDILAVQNTSADTYYKAIANLKGVDVASSSINFQILNARGFASTGNTRFVQLIDGMDTQAPALNFPIGNLNGPSVLDVESVELIPGASSALYGANAFNGVLLINSKNPFEYQGVSAFVKTGVNHVSSDADQDPAIMNTFSLRYAKAFNNKLAFKVNGTYSYADDWHGTSTFDRNADNNPFPDEPNIGADRLHKHGDEAAANIALLGIAAAEGLNEGLEILFRDNNLDNGNTMLDYARDLPSHTVSLTPFDEVDLIDYGAENLKINTGLYYRLNDDLELSALYNAGFGTSIYTGAQRYSLSNFGIQQGRLQLRGDNFFVRAYGTFENSGDSYITEFLALRMNEELAFTGGRAYTSNGVDGQRYVPRLAPSARSVNNMLVSYSQAYIQFLASGNADLPGLDPGEITSLRVNNPTLAAQYDLAAHQRARQFMNDVFQYEPGSPEFEEAKRVALEGTIPEGPGFADKSAMYQADAQYDFKNEVDFMELQVGGSYRIFDLRSEGTIFPDKDGGIQINEFGGYVQVGKRVIDNLKLSGSVRFDKNENFKGQVNPRISGVYTAGSNHNFRASYQTGFRNPTTQGQYIDLSVISARLLGGLQENYDKYQLARTSRTGADLSFTAGSVEAFKRSFFGSGGTNLSEAVGLLTPFTSSDIKPVVPEQVRSIEFGYKSLIGNKLLVDAVYYHNTYTDFITQIQVVVADEATDGSMNPLTLISGSAITIADGETVIEDPDDPTPDGFNGNTAQIYSNLEDDATAQGAALGLTYNLPRGYTVGGNYSWNKFIGGFTDNNLNEFNTPEHKFNVNFGNRKITDKLGFNVTYRWQEAFRWESSFAVGDVPSYSTIDAQISLKLEEIKSVLKIGGSNLFGDSYIQSLGGPNIGSIYYVSLTYDELMN
ncbi:TonB-dependent Receptor Plug Domain [Ekhidna lutea]|uniref:TonB-dependent Receptor Plug Domain n=1 Tax=Ekhidna lutea TaxID=447679 RepID=A0A239L8F6_EKHLU|nr:TonB-dependent receptor [Ekhidna lutea]SNT26570.1 TonB-dependent Receptor Plug Domain [Ekhidna lutea]